MKSSSGSVGSLTAQACRRADPLRTSGQRNELMQAAVDHAEPPVRTVCDLIPCVNSRGTDDHLLVIHVEPSEVVHTTRKDECYWSREVMEMIREVGGLSTGDVADGLGLSKPATLKRLRALEKAGLVEWVGKTATDPRAYWRLRSD